MTDSLKGNMEKWNILGPGGGGAQFRPTISPHDPDTMLIACDMTGAYITRNGGRTWRQFNLRTRVDSFAFDPAEPSTIYAGSSGLFRSKDGGEKWSLIFPDPSSDIEERAQGDEADHSFISGDNWPGGKIQAIQVDPINNDNIYVGIYRDRRLSVYHSRNYGRNWAEIYNEEGTRLYKLYPDPTSPLHERRLFIFSDVGTAVVSPNPLIQANLNLPKQIKKIIHSACGVNPDNGIPIFYITVWNQKENENDSIGIWKSEDIGKSWIELSIKLNENTSETEIKLIREYSMLAVPEINGNCIYAGIGGILWIETGGYQEICEDSGAGSVISYYGVIKSADGGKSWSWVLKFTYDSYADNLTEGWSERDYDYTWYLIGPKGMGPIGFNTSPVSADICCYTDLSSSFLTKDGGATWKKLYSNDHPDGSVSTRGMDVTTCYGVHFDPFDREHIAISYTDIGMFHSRDGGCTWLHVIKDVPAEWGNTCYWMVFDPEVKGKVWSAWGSAHDLPRTKMFKMGRFHLWKGGILRSEDGIATWRKSNEGMHGNSVTTHIILDPASPKGKRTLYTTAFDRGVYKSIDDGFTWSLKNNGISGNFNAWRIVILPDGTLFLLVARGLKDGKVVDGALYKSANGAEDWEKAALPAGVNAPNDLAFDPNDPLRMYLACWPYENLEANRYGGLYATSDGGKSWQNIFDPSSYIYGVAVHPDNPSTLFTVTFNSAVYRSDDKGETWSRLKGYTFKWGHRPIIDPYKKDMLYITTFGSSVWYGPAGGNENAFEDIYPFRGQ